MSTYIVLLSLAESPTGLYYRQIAYNSENEVNRSSEKSTREEEQMYLPEIFKRFMEKHGEICEAYRKVGDLCSKTGPVEGKNQHLIQLGTSIGIGSKGGVRSHARRALDAGATKEEVMQVVLLSTTIIGFPAMIAAYGWVEEVLNAGTD
jgi:alkylhydroperoxidase/carboxymuconolactone decarboxylase family protein YurZ